VTEAAAITRGRVGLLPHQLDVLADTASKVRVLQGGYRSGKTVAGVAAVLDMALRNAGHPLLVVEPSYRMIMDVFVATAQAMLTAWKVPFSWRKSDKILTIGKRLPVDVYCRSADEPRSLEGLTVAGCLVDEWELCGPEALRVAMARVSVGPHQRIVLTGTPEGYGPAWSMILEKPRDGTRVWTVSSKANTTLRSDYVDDMRGHFDDVTASEKLDGVRQQKGGRVYTRFDRAVHFWPCVDGKARGVETELWCDFNIGAHCWLVVDVDYARGRAHVAREVIGHETDTEEQCVRALDVLAVHLGERHRRSYTRDDVRRMKIEAPCDASARNRAAIGSHAAVMREYGFRPLYSSRGNPAVEDRVLAVQLRLASRPARLTIDPERAPFTARAIEQQGRDASGAPAKDRDPRQDLSGPMDALGYGIHWRWPAFQIGANRSHEERQREYEESRRHAEQDRWANVIT
jgi:hypothetical protein